MFDLEAVYWTLSTIAQTMVALVAFVGFVAVWRLQGLDRQLDEARAMLTRYAPGYHHTDQALLDLSAETMDMLNDFPTEEIRDEFVRQQGVLKVAADRVPKIRRALVWLAGSGIVATALSLGLLAIAPRLVGPAADLGEVAPIAFFLLFLVVATSALPIALFVLLLSFRR
jgi:hypothetical protein